MRALDVARQPQRREHLPRGHAVGRRRLVGAADRAFDHAQDQHQHRRQQIDRDRAGPARQEVAGVTHHGFRRRQRLEALRFDRRRVENLVGRTG